MGGTLAFLAPEQATDFRYAKPAADQYSLAATLFYLLTATLVYDKSSSQLRMLGQILKDDPLPLRPDAPPLPEPFGAIIRRGLARDPAARYPNLRAMKAALGASE